MTDVHSPAYGLTTDRAAISWRAVLAGAIVAIAVGAMFNLLGLALGAASLNPFSLDRGDGEEFSALAGIWVALSNLLGLLVGGFVASRVAQGTDGHRGLLLGLAVWALSFLFAIGIAGMTTAAGVSSVLNGAAERAAVDERFAGPEFADPRDPALPPPVRETAEDAADATGAMALWAFLTMLLGAVGAVLGARYGLKRHEWERRVDTDTAAAPMRPARPRPTPTV